MNNLSKPFKRLWRARKDRKIAGVCGGIAHYFRVDPIWIRLIFILFFLAGGMAFLVYVILWVLVPLEPIQEKNTLDDLK